MAVTALVDSAYREVVADVLDLSLIQYPSNGTITGCGLELVVAASLPDVSVQGTELAVGETITGRDIEDLGTIGKLYGKVGWGAASADILTLP